jgi:hypothetical protein
MYFDQYFITSLRYIDISFKNLSARYLTAAFLYIFKLLPGTWVLFSLSIQ